MLQKLKSKEKIIGLRRAPNTSFVNLQYANDTLIFGSGSVRDVVTIKWVLCYYETWSGLKVNFIKSSLVCLGSRNVTMQIIREVFRCREEQFPITYMGIPVKPGKLTKKNWLPLLDCFVKKIRGLEG